MNEVSKTMGELWKNLPDEVCLELASKRKIRIFVVQSFLFNERARNCTQVQKQLSQTANRTNYSHAYSN